MFFSVDQLWADFISRRAKRSDVALDKVLYTHFVQLTLILLYKLMSHKEFSHVVHKRCAAVMQFSGDVGSVLHSSTMTLQR